MGILTALLEREVRRRQWSRPRSCRRRSSCWISSRRWLMEKEVANRPATSTDQHPTGVFQTSDGYIHIATRGADWERSRRRSARRIRIQPRLCNRAVTLEESRRAQRRDRRLDREEKHPTALKELTRAGVPCGPIYSIARCFEDAQVQHLGIARTFQRRAPPIARSASRSRCRARGRDGARPPESARRPTTVAG